MSHTPCRRATDYSQPWPRPRNARSRRATSPPTATPPTASSCSSGWSAASRCRAPRSRRCASGGAQLKDGYALIRDGELYLHNVHIPPYAPAAQANHEPERDRRLLAKRNQIDRFADQIKQKGLTLVPTRIYFSGGRAKVEIALAKGKDRFDKRESIKERETKRDMDRALRDANR